MAPTKHQLDRLDELDELREATARVDALVRSLDPEACGRDLALGLLGEFARLRKVAAAGEALAARRVEACSAHESSGHSSTAHLVASLSGTSIASAKASLETARRLKDCAATDAALRAGEVSLEQAAVVTETAAVDPNAEGVLLEVAHSEPFATLTSRAREVKLAADDDRLGRYRRQHAARSLRHGITDQGMVWGRFQLPPDTGAAVITTLEREADHHFRTAHRDRQPREDHDRYLADALVATVTGTSSGEPGGESGDDGPASANPADRGDTAIRTRPRPAEVVVHVSLDALSRGDVDSSSTSGELCTIPGVGPVPVEIPKQLLDGDAFLKGVLVDGTDVLRVKHFGRKIPAAVRTALETRTILRDGTLRCSADHCDQTLGLQWDHREPVARGGPTSYHNLQPLCRRHHSAKTAAENRAPP